jgi:hypothetical protein
MESSMAVGFALAISLASVLAANATEEIVTTTHPHRHHYRVNHRIPAVRDSVAVGSTAQAARPVASPVATPVIQKNSDGLSRDPEDCNTGCLDNTE